MRSVSPSGSEGVLFRFSFASQQSLVWTLSFLYLHFQRPLVLVLLFPFRADVQQHWHWLFPIPFLSDPETLWYWSHVSAFLWSPDERASIASLVCFIFFAGYYERDCRLKNP